MIAGSSIIIFDDRDAAVTFALTVATQAQLDKLWGAGMTAVEKNDDDTLFAFMMNFALHPTATAALDLFRENVGGHGIVAVDEAPDDNWRATHGFVPKTPEWAQ